MPDIPFELKANRWYAWEMLPGYSTTGREMNRYYSPIYVHKVRRLKTGKGLLRLEFFNACYAVGVKGFDLTLRVLARRYHFMMASIDGNDERCVVLAEISFDWVEKFCPHLLEWRPLRDAPPKAASEVSAWLDYAFASG
jgi:hypothetical protein